MFVVIYALIPLAVIYMGGPGDSGLIEALYLGWMLIWSFSRERYSHRRDDIPSLSWTMAPMLVRSLINVGMVTLIRYKFGFHSIPLYFLILIGSLIETILASTIYLGWLDAYQKYLIEKDGPFDIIHSFSLTNPPQAELEHYTFFEFIARKYENASNKVIPRITAGRYLIYISNPYPNVLNPHVTPTSSEYSLMLADDMEIVEVIEILKMPHEDSKLILDGHHIHCLTYLIEVKSKNGARLRFLFKDGIHYEEFKSKYSHIFGQYV